MTLESPIDPAIREEPEQMRKTDGGDQAEQLSEEIHQGQTARSLDAVSNVRLPRSCPKRETLAPTANQPERGWPGSRRRTNAAARPLPSLTGATAAHQGNPAAHT